MRLARLLFPLFLVPLAHAQVTSENNDRLREGLKKHPESDTNRDGILTMEEGLAYLAKMKDSKGKGVPKASADAPKPDVADVA